MGRRPLTRGHGQGKLAGGGDPAPNLWWPPQRARGEAKGGTLPDRAAPGAFRSRGQAAGEPARDPTEDWVMPTDKDFKRLVRARMGRTGESYTTARARLRPDGDPTRPGPLRGRHPDTAALTRLLAALGVTGPDGGRPLTEAMALGIAGGIGFAYFVFEYEELTT